MADAKRFDLIAALEGRSYPEDTVTIFLDEALMYEYSKAKYDADRDPANEEKQETLKTLMALIKDLSFKVHLRGVPRFRIVELSESVAKDFPVKTNAFGNQIADPKANEVFTLGAWALHITGFEPAGAERFVPTSQELESFRRLAPAAALEEVGSAIDRLSQGARSGYEQIVMDPDFLSQPSPTE